ncbi:hypothetical protein APY03_6958 [Variovorax sp. WDL1]|nr:hypothetical protein APY03_6958 [Variovorax sp. WDL1]
MPAQRWQARHGAADRNHESSRTNGLYYRREHQVSLDEIEMILI